MSKQISTFSIEPLLTEKLYHPFLQVAMGGGDEQTKIAKARDLIAQLPNGKK